jgi:hypothetical protein
LFSPFQSCKHRHAIANNGPNQLQKKVNTNKHDKWKQIPTYKSYNKKITCKKEMIQTPYLKGGGGYYEHCHYHYRYIRWTNNNSLKRNSNKAYNIWPYNHNEHKSSLPIAIQATVGTNVMWGPTIAPCSFDNIYPLNDSRKKQFQFKCQNMIALSDMPLMMVKEYRYIFHENWKISILTIRNISMVNIYSPNHKKSKERKTM